MPAAELVIKLLEQLYRRAEPFDVGHANANTARNLTIRLTAGIDQPPQRSIIPGARF
jgi:hypothetical protein